MKRACSLLVAIGLVSLPSVCCAQEVSWRLLSTTGGLVVAPSYPSPENVHFFERQQLRNTVRVSSLVHPATFYRVAVRREAAASDARPTSPHQPPSGN